MLIVQKYLQPCIDLSSNPSYLLLILFASSNVFPSLWVFFVISEPARSEIKIELIDCDRRTRGSTRKPTDEVYFALLAYEDALLAFRLLLRSDVHRENRVAAWRVIVHLMRADRSVLHALLQHRQQIIQFLAVDQK